MMGYETVKRRCILRDECYPTNIEVDIVPRHHVRGSSVAYQVVAAGCSWLTSGGEIDT